jgi:pimeloyl-ACP methyl ester carboxylesterase
MKFKLPTTPLAGICAWAALGLGLALLSACTAAPEAAAPPPRLALSDCQLAAPGLADRKAAKCAALSVPEDRASPQGRQIALNIAVIPATASAPQPEPRFFLTGGPGQAATESYLALRSVFDRIQQDRDIVLVDQRGTGKSNPLRCPSGNQDELSQDETAQSAWLRACLDSLKDSDLRQYTTPAAVEDLDQVRQALGYNQINLYGLSYGTRVALSYLQRYPQHVRTVILDGIVPQDEPLGLDVARDAQRSLDLIFARCAADPACSAAFPELPAEFQGLLDLLQDGPLLVSLRDPLSGEMTELSLSREQFGAAVRLLSYTPETVALLPLLIHTAYETQDFSLLAAQYLVVVTDLSNTLSLGMNFSVLCSEDAPFIDFAQAARLNQGAYLADLQTSELEQICSLWPRGVIPADFKQPVTADAPVLLLSGEADPVTPPENGEQAAKSLPNSLHLVAPGQGHNVIYRGCLPKLARQFIEQADFAGLDTACVAQIQAPPFFLNYNGPTP